MTRDVSATGRKSFGTMLSIFDNEKELTRAILEAAYRANPDVKIDPELLRRYGHPPYGIFEPK